ncbi:hypothetical protein JCM10914A_03450 [Paenibacillus sp. JCM 10914]
MPLSFALDRQFHSLQPAYLFPLIENQKDPQQVMSSHDVAAGLLCFGALTVTTIMKPHYRLIVYNVHTNPIPHIYFPSNMLVDALTISSG